MTKNGKILLAVAAAAAAIWFLFFRTGIPAGGARPSVGVGVSGGTSSAVGKVADALKSITHDIGSWFSSSSSSDSGDDTGGYDDV